MKLKLFLMAAFCALFALPSSAQEVVTTQTILDLLNQGLDSDLIIEYVETASDRQIQVGAQEMIALKEAGANNELIKYLRQITKTDFGFEGVYWVNNGTDKPTKLFRTNFQSEKSGFKGGALGAAVGIAGTWAGISHGSGTAIGASQAAGVLIGTSSKDVEKLVIPGKNAKIVLTGETASNPVFRFYFPKAEGHSFDQDVDGWYYAIMTQIDSPNMFQCIKMKEKKDKRTFPDGTSFSVAGFEGKGNGAKNIVDFEIQANSNNVFEVSFPNGLEPGEYVFFYKDALNNEYFKAHPFGFDFSVQ